MPDERTSAEDLITELIDAAGELAPADIAVFAAEARDELAAYRQRRETVFVREPGGFEPAASIFTIPERYAGRAEVFVVFEVFVRCFIDPIVVAAEIPNLLIETDDTVERLGFARFGEELPETISVRDNGGLIEDAAALTAMAEDLGRELFGARFRSSDFWGGLG
jgi:CRISPR/Cas system-associated protein Csm6